LDTTPFTTRLPRALEPLRKYGVPGSLDGIVPDVCSDRTTLTTLNVNAEFATEELFTNASSLILLAVLLAVTLLIVTVAGELMLIVVAPEENVALPLPEIVDKLRVIGRRLEDPPAKLTDSCSSRQKQRNAYECRIQLLFHRDQLYDAGELLKCEQLQSKSIVVVDTLHGITE
jgi:hypothetical protein